MEIDELITVGVLGKSIDKNGFFTYRSTQGSPQGFNNRDEFFLIKDHRVRYVDVEFSRDFMDKVKICDPEMTQQIIQSGGARIALGPEEINSIREESGLLSTEEKNVVFNGEAIGKLIDIFNNKAHDVLVIELKTGKEIMIPFVEYFVTGSSASEVVVRNIEDFLVL